MPRQLAILGAGPIGLDAALAGIDAGWSVTVYEASDRVGATVSDWGHVRLFTPWNMNLSTRMRSRLPAAPDDSNCPTGAEFLDAVLYPLADLAELADRLRFGERVIAVSREGLLKHEEIGTGARSATPFRLLLEGPAGEHIAHADLVLDCTGNYHRPNPLGPGGIAAPGERALGDRIRHTMPSTEDPARWRGRVLLVGAGKSAQTAARGLSELPGTVLDWVVRAEQPDWGVIAGDSLPQRQELVDSSRNLTAGANPRTTVHSGHVVRALHAVDEGVRVTIGRTAQDTALLVDHVIGLTGYTGDSDIYRQLQVHECYATGAPMNLSAALLGAAGGDCLAQPTVGVDTLRNPEPDFFILGVKSYGRLNTFLLRTGYDQVGQVIGAYE